jgi:hypothetical protein
MVRRRFVLMTPGHFDRMATKTYDSSFRLSSLECTADYIVHAANAYPKLVEMLKNISTDGYVIASVALYFVDYGRLLHLIRGLEACLLA